MRNSVLCRDSVHRISYDILPNLIFEKYHVLRTASLSRSRRDINPCFLNQFVKFTRNRFISSKVENTEGQFHGNIISGNCADSSTLAVFHDRILSSCLRRMNRRKKSEARDRSLKFKFASIHRHPHDRATRFLMSINIRSLQIHHIRRNQNHRTRLEHLRHADLAIEQFAHRRGERSENQL